MMRETSPAKVERDLSIFPFANESISRDEAALLVYKEIPSACKATRQLLGDEMASRHKRLLETHHHAKQLDLWRRGAKKSQTSASFSRVRDKAQRKFRELTGGTESASPIFPTSLEDTLEYLPFEANKAKPPTQCPICFMPLDTKDDGIEGYKPEVQRREYWKSHIDRHLQPYACLFPNCDASALSLTDRQKWRFHMNWAHGPFWKQLVNTTCDMECVEACTTRGATNFNDDEQGIFTSDTDFSATPVPRSVATYATTYNPPNEVLCNIDHDPSLHVETQPQPPPYMRSLVPETQSQPPGYEESLEACPDGRVAAEPVATRMRTSKTCPICEEIPEDILHLELTMIGSRKVYPRETLDEHVADHLLSLALLSMQHQTLYKAT
jgi:hypothetical protein